MSLLHPPPPILGGSKYWGVSLEAVWLWFHAAGISGKTAQAEIMGQNLNRSPRFLGKKGLDGGGGLVIPGTLKLNIYEYTYVVKL
jgi:hypothetical protein